MDSGQVRARERKQKHVNNNEEKDEKHGERRPESEKKQGETRLQASPRNVNDERKLARKMSSSHLLSVSS